MGRTGQKVNSDGGKCFVGETKMEGGAGCLCRWGWTSRGVVRESLLVEAPLNLNGVQEPRWGALEAGGGADRVSDEPWRRAATGFLSPGGQ